MRRKNNREPNAITFSMMRHVRVGKKNHFRYHTVNGPFPSSCLPPLQIESKCKVLVMVISPTLHMNELIFIRKTSHLDSL